MYLSLALATLAASVALGAGDTSPSFVTYNGAVKGAQCAYSQVNYFFGIPYGKNPARFAAPQLFDSKYGDNGTLDATQPAPSCLQFGTVFLEDGAQSEDCLLLDIYTPANATSSSALPVKVWLYGQNDAGGGISDPEYTGCYAAKEAIMVTINYRLGPLGFLSLPSAGLRGNYGIQDQLLALQWIQENIHFFGGDPKRVLLFGHSAGAVDAFVLSTLPQASSLFSAAITESGGGRDLVTIEEASTYMSEFVQKLNCSTSDINCISAASIAQLNQSFNALDTVTVPVTTTLWVNHGFGDDWGPVIDGNLIAEQPSKVGVRVPTILGGNTQEGNFFTLPLALQAPDPNGTVYHQFMLDNFGPLAATVSAKYPISAFNSTRYPSYGAMSAAITDYSYTFNHTPSCSWDGGLPWLTPEVVELMGPTHMTEIPFVFGTVDHLPLPSGNCSFTAAEIAISGFMEGAWTRMAALGKPTANETDWPKWTQNASMGIVINDAVKVTQFDYSVCEFWDQIAATISQLDANGTAAGNATTSSLPTATEAGATATSTVSSGAGMILVSGNLLLVSLLTLYLGML